MNLLATTEQPIMILPRSLPENILTTMVKIDSSFVRHGLLVKEYTNCYCIELGMNIFEVSDLKELVSNPKFLHVEYEENSSVLTFAK